VPFNTVYLHGLVRNEDGQKMSKSKAPGSTPAGHGRVRHGCPAIHPAGGFHARQRHQPEPQESGRQPQFANKIWNAGRFVIAAINTLTPTSLPAGERRREQSTWSLADSWIWARLYALVREVERLFQTYQYGEAGRQIYEFFWNDFADWYVKSPSCKCRRKIPEGRRRYAGSGLDMCLRLLHPFTPFVTEELWGISARQYSNPRWLRSPQTGRRRS